MISWNIRKSKFSAILFALILSIGLWLGLAATPVLAVVCPTDDPNCCNNAGSICNEPGWFFRDDYSIWESDQCRKTTPQVMVFPEGEGFAFPNYSHVCSTECYTALTRPRDEGRADQAVLCYPRLSASCQYSERCGPRFEGTRICSGTYGQNTGAPECESTASQCTPCAYCGNNVCETGEGADNCPADCSTPAPAACGDGFCAASEMGPNSSCRSDCDPIRLDGQCRYEQGGDGNVCPVGSWQICTGTPNQAGVCQYNSSVNPNCGPCSSTNGRCEPGEPSVNHPDCVNPPQSVCGNNICEIDETETCRDCTRFAYIEPGDTSGGGTGLSCAWNIPSGNEFELCFSSNDYNDLVNGEVRFRCENIDSPNNCGGIAMQIYSSLFDPVRIPVGNNVAYNPTSGAFQANQGQASGRHFACWRGSWDQNKIRDVAVSNIRRACLQRLTIDITSFLIIGRIIPGGAATTISRVGSVAHAIANVPMAFQNADEILALNDGNPPDCVRDILHSSFGYVAEFRKDDLRCTTRLEFRYGNPEWPDALDPGEDYEGAEKPPPIPTTPFGYCRQVPEGRQRDACEQCLRSGGAQLNQDNQLDPKDTVYTSVGCIRVGQTGLAGDLIKLGLGIAGGLALCSLLAAAFLLSTSQGDSNKVKQAKELATAAVAGLFFMIFSVIILNFVGVQILRIPGLG